MFKSTLILDPRKGGMHTGVSPTLPHALVTACLHRQRQRPAHCLPTARATEPRKRVWRLLGPASAGFQTERASQFERSSLRLGEPLRGDASPRHSSPPCRTWAGRERASGRFGMAFALLRTACWAGVWRTRRRPRLGRLPLVSPARCARGALDGQGRPHCTGGDVLEAWPLGRLCGVLVYS
jgi:hypothetical protein